MTNRLIDRNGYSLKLSPSFDEGWSRDGWPLRDDAGFPPAIGAITRVTPSYTFVPAVFLRVFPTGFPYGFSQVFPLGIGCSPACGLL